MQILRGANPNTFPSTVALSAPSLAGILLPPLNLPNQLGEVPVDAEVKVLRDESEWRDGALRWFLAHGVGTNRAEDLAQEVCRRLLLCQQRQQALTVAYLHRTCQSVLCDHARRCKRELPLLSLDDCGRCAVAERGYQQVEDRLLLEQALAQLKPLECAIVERRYLEEQPFSAIGKELGIPTERAKKICQRAIKKMQKWAQSGGGG